MENLQEIQKKYLELIDNIDESYILYNMSSGRTITNNTLYISNSINIEQNGEICRDEKAKLIIYYAISGQLPKDQSEKNMYKSTKSSDDDTTKLSIIENKKQESTYLGMWKSMGPMSYLKDTYSYYIGSTFTEHVVDVNFVTRYKIKLETMLICDVSISEIKKSGIASSFENLKKNLSYKPTDLRINKKLFNVDHLISLYKLPINNFDEYTESDFKEKELLIDMLLNYTELHVLNQNVEILFKRPDSESEKTKELLRKLFLYRIYITCNRHAHELLCIGDNNSNICQLLLHRDSLYSWVVFLQLNFDIVSEIFQSQGDTIKLFALFNKTYTLTKKFIENRIDKYRYYEKTAVSKIKESTNNNSNSSSITNKDKTSNRTKTFMEPINETNILENTPKFKYSCLPNLLLVIGIMTFVEKPTQDIINLVGELDKMENLSLDLLKSQIKSSNERKNMQKYDQKLIPTSYITKSMPKFEEFINLEQKELKVMNYDKYKTIFNRMSKAIKNHEHEKKTNSNDNNKIHRIYIFLIEPSYINKTLEHNTKTHMMCSYGLFSCSLVNVSKESNKN